MPKYFRNFEDKPAKKEIIMSKEQIIIIAMPNQLIFGV